MFGFSPAIWFLIWFYLNLKNVQFRPKHLALSHHNNAQICRKSLLSDLSMLENYRYDLVHHMIVVSIKWIYLQKRVRLSCISYIMCWKELLCLTPLLKAMVNSQEYKNEMSVGCLALQHRVFLNCHMLKVLTWSDHKGGFYLHWHQGFRNLPLTPACRFTLWTISAQNPLIMSWPPRFILWVEVGLAFWLETTRLNCQTVDKVKTSTTLNRQQQQWNASDIMHSQRTKSFCLLIKMNYS